MFAEMLSHSEEIIFLEAIDQNFESDSEFNPKIDETNENLEQMNVKFCEKLEEDKENISTENESYDSSFYYKTSNPKKFIMMKDCLFLDKRSIDELIIKVCNSYKSQVELKSGIKAISKSKV